MIILLLGLLKKNHRFTFYDRKMEVNFQAKIFKILEFLKF